MCKQANIGAAGLAALSDEELLEAVQRQTFGFFWEAAHPVSGLAPDRCTTTANPSDDLVATGGSGFGVMALIVAVERGWVTRAAAAERIGHMLDLLSRADLLSRCISSFHERAQRCDNSVHPQGRRRRSGRDLLPAHGTVVRTRILHP